MRRSQGRNPRSGNLARVFVQQASLFAFLFISIALLIVGKLNPGLSNYVHGTLVDVSAPIVDTIGQPVAAVRDFGRRSSDVLSSADLVEELRKENDALRRWQQVAMRLDEENAQLRALMRVAERQDAPVYVAQVVSDPSGPFLRAVVLNRGESDGIERYQPVLDESGVVGRVVTVGQKSSRVLLVTDLNSRVPVSVVRTGTRAILAGDNSRYPRLAFLPMEASIEVGDALVTSGDGGIFPPNLAIGTIDSIDNGVARVRLTANLSRLDFVNVLDYQPTEPPEDNPTEGSAGAQSASGLKPGAGGT